MLLLSLALSLAGQNKSLDYIAQYKSIAISEMERTGIPASIKLAQGLVESGAGSSTLAREANNHFGIKCNGGWTGETYHKEDDDYENGRLIKSCFRKFSSSGESYIAHSEFLTGQKRYATLFDLARQDYYSWAKGLKKAGYATDPAYAQKLINKIEEYQLYQYDDAISEVLTVTEADSQTPSSSSPTEAQNPHQPPTEVVMAEVEKAPPSRRSRDHTRRKRKKGSSASPKEEAVTHRVQEGESLASIARRYDLEETTLRLRNRIPKDAEPLAGEKIHLRKNISLLKRPKFTRVPASAVASADDYLF